MAVSQRLIIPYDGFWHVTALALPTEQSLLHMAKRPAPEPCCLRGRNNVTGTANLLLCLQVQNIVECSKQKSFITPKRFLFYLTSILASLGLCWQPKQPSETNVQDLSCSYHWVNQGAIVTPLISPDSNILYSFTSFTCMRQKCSAVLSLQCYIHLFIKNDFYCITVSSNFHS